MGRNKMIATKLAKPTAAQLLSLNIGNVDLLFPGFAQGDFSIICGSSASTIASLLCVRAQLANQLGGLGSSVVFVDGGNTFELYRIAQLAKMHHLPPKQALDNIYVSRAFTAYQLVTLIMQKMKLAIAKFNAKTVIISDLTGFFLDKDIPEFEAKRIFSQASAYLSNFARENNIALIATHLPHRNEKLNNELQALAAAKSGVVLSLQRTKYDRVISLDKHPYLKLGSINLPSHTTKITDFIGVTA